MLPRLLVEIRCFPELLDAVNRAQERRKKPVSAVELIEEQAGEEDLPAEAKNDKDKVTQKLVNARLAQLKKTLADPDELAVLNRCLTLIKAEASAKKAQKVAQAALDRAVFEHYPDVMKKRLKRW